MPDLMIPSSILIAVFALLAAVDGLFFHLWKYKLHRWRDTRWEHQLHTARAVLFPGVVALLWLQNSAGVALWAAAGLLATDLVIQMVDVLVERDARTRFGGLSSLEYAVHVALTGLHVGAVTLAFASKPASAWARSAPSVLEAALPALSTQIAELILPGAVVIGLLHLWLTQRRFLVEEASDTPVTDHLSTART